MPHKTDTHPRQGQLYFWKRDRSDNDNFDLIAGSETLGYYKPLRTKKVLGFFPVVTGIEVTLPIGTLRIQPDDTKAFWNGAQRVSFTDSAGRTLLSGSFVGTWAGAYRFTHIDENHAGPQEYLCKATNLWKTKYAWQHLDNTLITLKQRAVFDWKGPKLTAEIVAYDIPQTLAWALIALSLYQQIRREEAASSAA